MDSVIWASPRAIARTLLAACAAVAILFSGAAEAYTPLTVTVDVSEESSATKIAKWATDRYPSGIPYLIATDEDGEGTTDLDGDREIQIVREGFAAWQSAPNASVAYQFLGATDQVAPAQVDNLNTVGFVDDKVLARAGILALTIPVIRAEGDNGEAEIVEGDILLIDATEIEWIDSGENRVSDMLGSVSRFNFKETVLREIGYLNGLQASFARFPYEEPLLLAEEGIIYHDNRGGPFSSVSLLYPYAVEGSPALNGSDLGADEIAGLSALYPAANASDPLGALRGTVRMLDTETRESVGFCGAHVVAVDPVTYQPVASTISGPDGSFEIDGLNPGDYKIWVEPSSPADIDGLYPELEYDAVDFYPAFLPRGGYDTRENAERFTVAAGKGLEDEIEVFVIRTVVDGENVYAPRGFQDEAGNRVILEVIPDNTQEGATDLRDVNRDGVITVRDIISDTEEDSEDPDVDFYRFQATRDDVIEVKVIAEADGSALDPEVRLYGPGNQPVPFASDDGVGEDVTIVFTAPETANYYVEITDRFDRGGNRYFYTLLITTISARVPLSPLSPPVSVLSFPISDADLIPLGLTDPTFGNVEITELRVQFLDVDGDGGLNPDGSDFQPGERENNSVGAVKSGFSLFRDDGIVPGAFDLDVGNPDQSVQDSVIPMGVAPEVTDSPFGNGFEVVFTPEQPIRIEAAQRQDDVPDIHVVVRTSDLFHHGDDFQVVLPAGGVVLRINNVAGQQTITLFDTAFPPPLERNKYTGDIVTLTTYIPVVGASIDSRSSDYGVLGLNLVGDPGQEYWLSEVEVTFVGYNYLNLREFMSDRFDGLTFQNSLYPNQFVDPVYRTWEMSDLAPFADGDIGAGGVNVYRDNSVVGSTGDGVPNFGLNGDLRLALSGAQRFEVVPVEEVPDDIIVDLYPHFFSGTFGFTVWSYGSNEGNPPVRRGVLELDEFLALRDQLNLFAFKAILPLEPSVALAVPDDDEQENNAGDFFVSLRTSSDTRAHDVFIPYVQVDGIKIKSDLSDVLANGNDPSFSSLVNGGSLRKIDPTTRPKTTVVEVRPSPSFALKDLVNPNDATNRGPTIGAFEEGSPPLGVVGIDAQSFGATPMRSRNPAGNDPFNLFNQGPVLDRITVFIDPVESPALIPLDFVRPLSVPGSEVTANSFLDPDLLGFPAQGLTLHVDDNTPSGNFLDDDFDGLFDEELVNDTDDDLDGLADEDDFGDEDDVGTNGQLDLHDDVIAYLQQNDAWLAGRGTHYVQAPLVTQVGNSIQIDFPSLRANVGGCETAGDSVMASDPFSVFIDDPYVRVDHPPITDDVPFAACELGGTPVDGFQNGFYVDYDEVFFAEGGFFFDDIPFNSYTYSYATMIPPSDDIPELVGPDFFVTMRTGLGSTSGDSFRLRIPREGIGYSTYRDRTIQNVRAGTYPPLDFNTTAIKVGTGNVAPSLTFTNPANGPQPATRLTVDNRVEFEYTVTYTFDDPDNDAVVDLFFDTDNFGVDGEPIPVVAGEQTTNVVDSNGQFEQSFTFQFPPELANQDNTEIFIYGIVTDDVNPIAAVYSNGSIVLSATDVFDAVQDYIIADNIGQIFGTGDANVNIPDLRQNTNLIRDVELTPSARGALFLNGYGEVALSGDPDPWAEFVRTSNIVNFPEGNSVSLPLDLARDIEPDFQRDGYYLLDAMGTVHPVGAVPPPDFPLSGGAQFSGDAARDMELTSTGRGLLLMEGSGNTVGLGDAPELVGPSFGMDIARDLALTPSNNGFFILDGYGNIFPVGDAASDDFDTSGIPLFLGSDVYRSIEVAPGNTGLLVMDREGQVFGTGNVILGPNVVRSGVLPPPPGMNEGELIDFGKVSPPTNVVVGEARGAFIDIETVGLGSSIISIRDILNGPDSGDPGDATDVVQGGICGAVLRENISELLSFFETDEFEFSSRGGDFTWPGFEDSQGHDLDDVQATWSSFFDYYQVVSCHIADASQDFQPIADTVQEAGVILPEDVVVVSASMVIRVMEPQMSVFGPSDEPTELEDDGDAEFGEIGEIFTLGPILFDQVVRYWEFDDGRGWHMNIIDDDHVEEQLDSADRVLASRDFFKTRRQRRYEGQGSVYLVDENAAQSSRNSEYMFQFIEEVEAPADDPSGGWFHPLVGVQWFSDADGGNLPLHTFTVPLKLYVLEDLVKKEVKIIGGPCAVFGFLTNRGGVDEIETDQTGSVDELIEGPSAYRFLPPIGNVVEPLLEGIYEGHLMLEGDTNLSVTDIFSSARIINLVGTLDITTVQLSGPPLVLADDYIAPEVGYSTVAPNNIRRILADGTLGDFVEGTDIVPLDVDLVITPDEVLDRLEGFANFEDTTEVTTVDISDASDQLLATAFGDDYVVTFSKEEQLLAGLPEADSRLYYAVFRIKTRSVQDDEQPTKGGMVFTWRFDPETDYIPYNTFKSRIDLKKLKQKFDSADQKPNPVPQRVRAQAMAEILGGIKPATP